MKKLMISAHPEWVEKILNGEKTIEVRPWIPKGELPLEVLIYVTKRTLYFNSYENEWQTSKVDRKLLNPNLFHRDGKVVAKFILNKAEDIEPIFGYQTNESDSVVFCGIYTDSLTQEELIKQSCIPNLMYKVYDKWEAEEYDEPRPTYAWKIDDLVIFDKPKELGEFVRANPCKSKHLPRLLPLTKAPQKMVWVEE